MTELHIKINELIRTELSENPELIGVNIGSYDGFLIAHESKEQEISSLSISHNLPYSLSSKKFVSASNSAILNVTSKIYKEMLILKNFYSISIGDIGSFSLGSEKVSIIAFVKHHTSPNLNFLKLQGILQKLENCIEGHKKSHKKVHKGILKSIKGEIPECLVVALISKQLGLPIKVRPKRDLDLISTKITYLYNRFSKLIGDSKYFIIGGNNGHVIINNSDEDSMITIVIPSLDMDEYLTKINTIANIFKKLLDKCEESLLTTFP